MMLKMALIASAILFGTAADAQNYYMRSSLNIAAASSNGPPPEPTWTHCARESSQCALPGGNVTWTVRYGVPGKWTYLKFTSASPINVPCDNYTFPDPAHEINKDCFRSSNA
jgi:hypothetical protein